MWTKKYVTNLSYSIVGLAIKVHKELGPGLLENVYEHCLKYELQKQGYNVIQQSVVPVYYDDIYIDTNLRFDLLVEETILIEIKACENLLPVHDAQIMTYMKLLRVPQGLLINFFTNNISKTSKPFVNEIFRNLPDE